MIQAASFCFVVNQVLHKPCKLSDTVIKPKVTLWCSLEKIIGPAHQAR